MSSVSGALRERVVVAHRVEPRTSTTTLADLRPGGTGHVVDVSDPERPAAARRLFDLGFAPGVEVEVVRRAPLADPVVFRIAGYEVALRRAEARCVQVCPAV